MSHEKYKILEVRSSTDRRLDFKVMSDQGKTVQVAVIVDAEGILRVHADSPSFVSIFVPEVGYVLNVDYFGHPHED